ncbi:MAG: hypothetical protein GY828_06175 [Candidatus Gracilibacteria bacterium]|nr:hypothetical protein [Candidatus Gracilibacteria bacterium]
MKKVYKDKIINIKNTDVFDQKFSFDYLSCDYQSQSEVEVIFMSELLEQYRNNDLMDQVKQKPAMYSNVYSPKDELHIFIELFESAVKNQKKIHIVGITLEEELKILEAYYEELGFLRTDVNCFLPNFKIPMVTVSVKIENLMWKGSDYKRMKEEIFFNPPIRESGQVKSLYKGINRGLICGIYISDLNQEITDFITLCIQEERILPIQLAKLLNYNISEVGILGEKHELIIQYGV